MIGILILAFITAYLAGALISAPKLMRMVYEDNLAQMAEKRGGWRTELWCRNDARSSGIWWSVVWPVGMTYFLLGATAFKDEIAAQHAKANAKVIADYDALLASRFDTELADAKPRRRPWLAPPRGGYQGLPAGANRKTR